MKIRGTGVSPLAEDVGPQPSFLFNVLISSTQAVFLMCLTAAKNPCNMGPNSLHRQNVLSGS